MMRHPENLQCRASNLDAKNLCRCQLLAGHGGYHENFDQGIKYTWLTIPKLTPSEMGGPREPLTLREQIAYNRPGGQHPEERGP